MNGLFGDAGQTQQGGSAWDAGVRSAQTTNPFQSAALPAHFSAPLGASSTGGLPQYDMQRDAITQALVAQPNATPAAPATPGYASPAAMPLGQPIAAQIGPGMQPMGGQTDPAMLEQIRGRLRDMPQDTTMTDDFVDRGPPQPAMNPLEWLQRMSLNRQGTQ